MNRSDEIEQIEILLNLEIRKARQFLSADSLLFLHKHTCGVYIDCRVSESIISYQSVSIRRLLTRRRSRRFHLADDSRFYRARR